VYPIEKVTLWLLHGVPHGEGYSMGGPWCAPYKRSLYGWSMVYPMHRGSYSMGGPWCTPLRRSLYGWFMVRLI